MIRIHSIHRRLHQWATAPRARRVFAIVFSLGCAVFLGVKTGIVAPGGCLYSPDISFRLQGNSFFWGEARLSSSPAAFVHDWGWRGAMYQLWGMGVPFLRLPFELLAQAWGGIFPDRIVFLIYYAMACLLLFTAPLGVWTERFRAKERLILRCAHVAMFAAAPIFFRLVGTFFSTYEERVAYCVLIAAAEYALLIRVIVEESLSSWVALCALAGLAVHVRPTLIVYGGLACGIAAFVIHRRGALSRIRLRPWHLGIFLIGPLALFGLNQWNFGSPLSFGENTQLSVDWSMFVGSFGNPVVRFSKLDLFHDFLGHMFPWSGFKMRTIQVSHLYFETYSVALLPCIILAIAALLAIWVRAVRKKDRLVSEWVGGALVWSIGALVVLGWVYMQTGNLAARYFADFVPVLAALFSTLLFWAVASLPWPELRIALPVCLVAGILFLLPASGRLEPGSRPITAAEVEAHVFEWEKRREAKPPALPSEYLCRGGDYRSAVSSNAIGWDYSGDCRAGWLTALYFDSPECVEFGFEIVESPEHLGILEGVKISEERWPLLKRENLAPNKWRDIYCAPSGSRYTQGVQLVRKGWAGFRDKILFAPKIRLEVVRKIPRPSAT